MHRITLVLVTAAGLATAMPGAGQHAWARNPGTRTVPGRPAMSEGSIRDLQTTLGEKGFSPGVVDGLWGPDTAGSVSRFQAANGLKATGRMNPATVTALASAGASSGATASAADPAPAMTPTAATPAAVEPASGVDASPAGDTGAAGNDNPAVATTGVNAARPAHGANSFSKGQAAARIAGHGFRNVADLRKDKDGVWRATANHDGRPVHVWLDYRGSVGQQ